MKNKIVTGIAIVMFSVATLAVQAAETNTAFSDYNIVKLSAQKTEAGAVQAWVLQYDENETPIIISLHQTKKSKYYVVRAENFEVAYTSGKNGFGASYVKPEFSRVPFELSSKVINDAELKRQKILTDNQPEDDNALELIAAFLPDLVNPSYKHLLN